MNFQSWIVAVQAIAAARNLAVVTTPRTGPNGEAWVTFNWRALNGTRYGSCGAGAEFIGLTSPTEFTWDWYADPDPRPETPRPPLHPPVTPLPANPWERRGRHVPRIPAMAVSAALIELFKVGKA